MFPVYSDYTIITLKEEDKSTISRPDTVRTLKLFGKGREFYRDWNF